MRVVGVVLTALAMGGVLLIPQVVEAQSTQVDSTVVPPSSALVPEGLATGDRFRVLFLTSSTRTATSTDIGDYNAFVQTAAAAGHEAIGDYSGGFRAVASTADVDARDNTNTTGAGVPIYWLRGNKLADDYADFYDGTWDDQTNGTDESGSARSISADADRAWTGSDHDGTELTTQGFPKSLGGGGTFFASAGALDGSLSSDGPLSGRTAVRNSSRPLYALSEVFVVGPDVTVSRDDLGVVEGSTATYTLVLDAEPSGNVTIDVTGGGDVTVEPTSLTFTAFTAGLGHGADGDGERC
ncbi:hypothetical protein [Candidatus Poriferisodalis sp.]|uniref:hypothetical protein n=1 Tax=Candidatus Poriferisodalis sp. TaxID=3101277 RepID=UPI003B5206C8